MKPFVYIKILTFLLIGSSMSGQNCDRIQDSTVLADFFEAMNGIDWKQKWNLNGPVDQWQGITLNSDGCVTEIILPNNNLSGTFSVLNLKHLKKIDLSDNNILSTIPHFKNNSGLTYINLSGNRFRGNLPQFTDHPDLEEIIFSSNQLDGTIPDYGALESLKRLELNDNRLKGEVSSLSNLSGLVYLDLSENEMEGSLDFISELNSIEFIDLSHNQFSGPFPEIANLVNCEYFYVSDNNITGPFTWPINMPSLTGLDISENQISGNLPAPAAGNLENLQLFFASYNQFSGVFPQLTFPSLTGLLLGDNKFEDTLDLSNVETLPLLEQISFENNLITNIQISNGALNQLDVINLEGNRLTFIDLIPYENEIGDVLFVAPQKRIPFPFDEFTITRGNNYTLELNTDEDHTNSRFMWYKNGVRINVQANHTLPLSNVSPASAGEYSVVVTNRRIPELTLFSDTLEIFVNCPLEIEEQNIYLCPGETFTYKGETYFENQEIVDTVLANGANTCDSLYIFNIQNVTPDFTDTTFSLCTGDIYYFGPDSIELTESGYYIDTFSNHGGCDSIVNLRLNFLPAYNITMDVGVCPNDSLVYGDTVYFEDVLLIDTFQTANGCDSVVTRNVVFSDPVVTHTIHNICNGDSVFVQGVYYRSDVELVDTLVAKGGCDSISMVSVMVHENYRLSIDTTICTPQSVEFNGRDLDESGVYTDTLSTMYGCDSIVTLNLTVNPSYFTHDTIYICEGDSVLFDGQYFMEEGIFFTEEQTENGCDSTAVIDIRFSEYAIREISEDYCAGDTAWFNNEFYTQSGIYSDTIFSEQNCDTLLVIDLSFSEMVITDTIFSGTAADSTGIIEIEVEGGVEPYEFMWSTGDTTQSLSDIPAGIYDLLISDAIGCTDSFSIELPVGTFIWSTVKKLDWVQIRPNVLSSGQHNSLSIDVLRPMRNAVFRLYNMHGSLIRSTEYSVLNSGQTLHWDLDELTAGIYWFNALEDGKRTYQLEKLIIQ
ncbi:hypothetical protein [Membranihabitans maritimus]|uniref:hypothetical protein n=1 Tax=Membranihabitans maritimus TaxID=2904244 RepID=UPI001F24FBEA|nr:hypothetical protein [Membranihabitans maritimus]